MPNLDFWNYILSPGFLITFGLTAGTFVPLLWSLWITWEENKYKEDALREQVRQEKAARKAARRERYLRSRRRVSASAQTSAGD